MTGFKGLLNCNDCGAGDCRFSVLFLCLLPRLGVVMVSAGAAGWAWSGGAVSRAAVGGVGGVRIKQGGRGSGKTGGLAENGIGYISHIPPDDEIGGNGKRGGV